MTTNEAFAVYNEFADSENYNAEILALAKYAKKEGFTTTEEIEPLIFNFVRDTFDSRHRVLIEKITSDVQYDMAYEVA